MAEDMPCVLAQEQMGPLAWKEEPGLVLCLGTSTGGVHMQKSYSGFSPKSLLHSPFLCDAITVHIFRILSTNSLFICYFLTVFICNPYAYVHFIQLVLVFSTS